MKTNVEKVLERDQKLTELDDRADALQQGATQFEQQAGKLKRKFWLQNLKVSRNEMDESKVPCCSMLPTELMFSEILAIEACTALVQLIQQNNNNHIFCCR